MTEKFLQYLWNYKVFDNFDFKDVEGMSIEILDFGTWNFNSGPDFLNAKIKTKNLTFAGNIELHLKSSDWILHNHQTDPEFQNVILHVVYEHDLEIEAFKKRKIPTLELKKYINEEILWKYRQLFNENHFIACEKIFDAKKIPFQFAEESLLRKLDEKSLQIEKSLKHFKNDYEAVLFHFLAYAFGLKINAETFKSLAESIDFKIIKRIQQNKTQLEALFFGLSGWLENPIDEPTKIWKKEFDFLKNKFQIPDQYYRPKFLRLRPSNFPTIRFSQLSDLYFQRRNLFSQIINTNSVKEVMDIFYGIEASDYWDNHFTFGKVSTQNRDKFLTKSFVDLIINNAVLPIKYTYHKHKNESIADEIFTFYASIPAEKNSVIKNWKELGVKIENALESQAFIYHYKKCCLPKNCLNCSIGFQLLKG